MAKDDKTNVNCLKLKDVSRRVPATLLLVKERERKITTDAMRRTVTSDRDRKV